MRASLTLQGSVVASTTGLYGVHVAGHDPKLDHVTGLDVIAVYGGNAD